eukprot:GFUD01114014.1.p1 GENE.GFUD01114014.1~~GFUD01114014.1.p1  ORF type:complete len:282 (+),score=50.92 GFUD01114014.1:35-880(+)
MATYTLETIFFLIIFQSVLIVVPAPSGLITIGDMILTGEQYLELYVAGTDASDGDGAGDAGDGDGVQAIEQSDYNLIAFSPGIIDGEYRWPNNQVSFRFENVDNYVKNLVEQTLEHLKKKLDGCIDFQEQLTSKPQDNTVNIKTARNSYSTLGYLPSPNKMRMGLAKMCNASDIEHQILHTLGIQHTQSRSDRDDHVDIIWNNIVEGSEYNFLKGNNTEWSNFDLPYDYKSVMHYGSFAFSKNRQMTIKTKDPQMQDVIGTAKGVSEQDIQLIKKMYNCKI